MKDKKLISLKFVNNKRETLKLMEKDGWEEDCSKFSEIISQLVDYFDGKIKEFNINYELKLSNFYQKVLEKTKSIPYGTVTTYKKLAYMAGSPLAWRATGSALASNPLPIIIPCHRIVRSDHRPGDFGLNPEIKVQLLKLEGVEFKNNLISPEFFI